MFGVAVMSLPALPHSVLRCAQAVVYTEAQMREYGALCRKAALEEAAVVCDGISTQHNDTYKHKPGPNAYDPHFQGLSMGAGECAEKIGELLK